MVSMSGRGTEMENLNMEATAEVQEEQKESIQTKIARFRQEQTNGHEVEAFLLKAELQKEGIWVD